MPLTRAMVQALHPDQCGGLWLFGTHLVIDVLDDSPPTELFGQDGDEAIRDVEIRVAPYPGKGVVQGSLLGAIALGLPATPSTTCLSWRPIPGRRGGLHEGDARVRDSWSRPVGRLASRHLSARCPSLPHAIPNPFIAPCRTSPKKIGSIASRTSALTSKKFRLFSMGIRARRAPLSIAT